jgi:hypothetical protein
MSTADDEIALAGCIACPGNLARMPVGRLDLKAFDAVLVAEHSFRNDQRRSCSSSDSLIEATLSATAVESPDRDREADEAPNELRHLPSIAGVRLGEGSEHEPFLQMNPDLCEQEPDRQ